MRTENKTPRLLLSYKKPYFPISRDTFGRWIKAILAMAGVDTSFPAHSTRSMSTSAASKAGVPLKTILEAAGWSQESTFTRFYKKQVFPNFGQSLLSSHITKSSSALA
ncbi:site-specific recombinase, phage integrase family [Elysia marginata]|uniref:Site-specific recombinase, phage integrase family n=1 Tax=Elysia marginata TaxID=1093978 RepID=A0AAV4IBE7_9GAST|nr:site-specific recombinase, phage integrase family [Elysia marginata]